MDFQFWIWLVVIVITLIARANKKKPGQSLPPENLPDPSRKSQQSQPQKSLTFEELLREIQGEKVLSKPASSQPKEKEYDYVDYDDDIPEEINDLEDVDFDITKDSRAFETYEAAKKEAFVRSTIEESVDVGRIVRSEHFKEYDLKKRSTTFNFIKELKDPKGFKKAFIMSEILNTKY